ncbi:MAG: diguanylate cyclase [Chloroflexota bacterium]|nr:diguanylate cyclase [Chloroflexota bacterium]
MIHLPLEPNNYIFGPLSAVTLTTACAVLILGLLVLVRERVSQVSALFFLLTVAVAIWMAAFSGAYASSRSEPALWWLHAAYLGIPFIAPAAYSFTVAALGLFRRYQRSVLAGWLLAVPFSVLGLSSNLLVTSFYHYEWGYYTRYGWLGALFTIFFVTLLIGSMVHYWVELQRVPIGVARQRIKWLMLASGVAYLGCIDFVDAFGAGLYPLGYIAVAAFICIAARAIWQYRLVDITPPVAARQILETMADGALVLDCDGVVQVVNGAACTLLGGEREMLIGRPVAALLDGLPFTGPEQWLKSGAVPSSLELKYTSATGAVLDLSVSLSSMEGSNGRLRAFVLILHDITALKQAESQIRKLNETLERRVVERTSQLQIANRELKVEIHERKRVANELKRSRDQLNIILRGVADGITVQDTTGAISFANDAAVRAFGFSSIEEMVLAPGSAFTEKFDLLDESREPFPQAQLPGRLALRGVRSPERVICFRQRATGEELWSIVHSTPVFDKQDRVQFAVNIYKDITERRRSEEVLRESAILDEVTGLYNRRAMNKMLSDEIERARRYERPLSLVMIDIDHFKRVNDTYGHQVGDEVLRWLADLLKATLRSTDRVARYGGEEFTVILPETEYSHAFNVAETLRHAVELNPFTSRSQEGDTISIPATVSLGVADISALDHSTGALIHAADQALYTAKREGRNRTKVFTTGDLSSVVLSSDLLTVIDPTHHDVV